VNFEVVSYYFQWFGGSSPTGDDKTRSRGIAKGVANDSRASIAFQMLMNASVLYFADPLG
jgi:hypothetical protein